MSFRKMIASRMERNDTTPEDFHSRAAKAAAAVSSGDWAAAVEGYEELIRSHPEQTELKYELARAYEEVGRLQDAIALLAHPSIAGLTKSKKRLAGAYIRAKNYAAAKPLVDGLFGAAPDDSKFQKWKTLCDVEVAKHALSSGDWALAASAYEELLRNNPDQAELKYELARAYEGLGRLGDAVALLSEGSVADQPKTTQRLAGTYIRTKNYAAAIPLVDELLAASPNNSKFASWKALCQNHLIGERLTEGQSLLAAERFEEAEQLYLDLLAQFPNDSRVLLRIGRIYLHQKRWLEAIPPLQAALALDPGNQKLRSSLARALFKGGQPAEAIALLESAGYVNKDVDGLIIVQRSHFKLRNWAQVEEVGTRLQAIVASDDPVSQWASDMSRDAVVEMATAGIDWQVESGDIDQAILSYRKVAERYPEAALAWAKLGRALARAERYEEAVTAFRSSLNLRPRDMLVQEALTRAIIDKGDEDEILSYAQGAVAAGTADFEVHRWLAQFHNRNHNWQPALENAQKALELNPEHASARMMVARALMRLSRLGEALEQLDILLKHGAKRVVALQLKADILIRLARIDDAIALYLKALRHAPDHPLINHRLSYAYLLKGDIAGFHSLHERRRNGRVFIENNKVYPYLDWNGELPIQGKLLVWSEFGLGVGQNILHMPFLKTLTALGLDVVFEVEPRLVDLCRRSFPDLTVVANDQTLPEGISHHTPIGSLSRWFKPDLESFATMRPYFLPDAEAVAAHRERLKRDAGDEQLLIGVSWTSNNPFVGDVKSVQLDQLLDAIALPGVSLVNLQYGDHSHSIEQAQAKTGKRLMDSGIDNSNDLDGLSAVVAAMDLVVCIGHTTAHMAGAVATPNFVLLPAAPFAHWLAEGERCIWYPASKLFRQAPIDHNWLPVLEQVRGAVVKFASGYNPDSWLATTMLPRLQPSSARAKPLTPQDTRDATLSFFGQGAFRSALALMGELPAEYLTHEMEMLRGHMLALIGRWNDANLHYLSLQSDETGDSQVEGEILSNHLAMYDLESALPLARKLAAEDPANRRIAANILYHLRRHDEALAELRALSMQAPQAEGITTLTATVLLEMGEAERAEEYLDDHAPMTRRADDYALLGRAISSQGRHEEALAAFEKGVALSRYNPSVNFWRTQQRIGMGLIELDPLPPLLGNIPDATPEDVVIYFAADSRFFWQHGLVLIASIGRSSPHSKCHVHVINPDAGVGRAIDIIRQILPSLDLSYSYEHIDFEGCTDLHIRTYYASVRFVRLAEMFGRSPAFYLCLDADSIVRNEIRAPESREALDDVGMYLRYHDHPQMAVLASASLFRPTPQTARFLDRAGNLIRTTLEAREAVWFLDQIVLGHVVRELGGSEVGITQLDRTYLDWFFEDNSLVWTGKGKRKSDDSRFTGEVSKYRFLQENEEIISLMPQSGDDDSDTGGDDPL